MFEEKRAYPPKGVNKSSKRVTLMKNIIGFEENSHRQNTFDNALDRTLREGARKLLQQAIEAEVNEYIHMHTGELEPDSRRSIVRNGYLPKRSLQTGVGPIEVQQPRVRDRRGKCTFTSAILPKYAR